MPMKYTENLPHFYLTISDYMKMIPTSNEMNS